MFRVRLFILVLLGLATAIAAPKSVKFPGSTRPYVSADGRFEVRWQEQQGDQPHQLFLRNRSDQTERELLSFSRHIEAFWSPKGAVLAVTNFDGSDHATTFIYSVRESTAIDLEIEVRRQSVVKQTIFDNHHFYLAAQRWLSPTVVRLRMWGYGEADPNGFNLLLDYDLNGNTFAKVAER